MKNNFQKIPLIVSLIFFVVFSAGFVFLYRATINNDQKALLGASAWQSEANRRDEIRSLDLSLQKIEGDRTQLETHFAKSSDIVPFLDTIEKLAPSVGASAQVDSVVAQDKNTSLVVGLKASGTFASVYKFLTLLENSPYELDFQSMDIHALSPTDDSGNLSKWEVAFKIKLLSFVP